MYASLHMTPTVIIPRQRRCSEASSGAVGIVASAGGIPALIELLGVLTADFPFPIFVAQHLARRPSNLTALLSWQSPLEILWAVQGERPRPGCVYVAPPESGLMVDQDGFALTPLGPASRSWLASADALIASLAHLYADRTVAIVLSGMMGAAIEGLRTVKACGGVTMAQDRLSSLCFEMPSAAIDFGKAEFFGSPSQIARALEVLAEQWAFPPSHPEDAKALARDNGPVEGYR
jgi:two-component system, chemotaxis family, protein-glutamate methylesterase/glutaminase